jgi:16S rRNA (uracil1498-N3)-methyltransferase
MSLHRFFVDEPVSGGAVRVTGRDLHHLRDVLRLAPGAEIAVADPSGAQAVARVVGVDAEEAVAEVVRTLPEPRLPDLTLLQGLSRGPKMDLVVQKATELGVRRIVPVAMHRSVVKLSGGDGAGKAVRWRRIAEEAAKQAQRTTLPAVDEPVRFEELPALLDAFDAVLVPWEASDGIGIPEALAGFAETARVAVLVGPEGGITPEEASVLAAHGARLVSLGPTILRTETAAIVSLALASAALGGLGAGSR